MSGVPELGGSSREGDGGGWGKVPLDKSVPNEPMRCCENSAFSDSPKVKGIALQDENLDFVSFSSRSATHSHSTLIIFMPPM